LGTVNEDIQSALNKHLSLMTPTMAIAWENKEYVPILNTPYLKTWLMPGETTRVTLGPNGFEAYVGVFQIDCLYPIKQGWYPAKAKAGAICTQFKTGTLVTYNSVEVRIIRSYPERGDVDGPFYKVPVSIYYQCFSND